MAALSYLRTKKWGGKEHTYGLNGQWAPWPAHMAINLSTFFYFASGDVHATCTYLIFLPSSDDVIYFASKNNTRLSFPSINNDVNYYPSKRKNDVNYGLIYVQRKVRVY